MGIRLRSVPAAAGADWIRQGFATFARKPAAFAGMFGLVLLGTLLISQLPIVGQLLVPMAMPLVSLGFMIATEAVVAGESVNPGQFFEPLAAARGHRRALGVLCAIYAVSTLVFAVLSHWVDGGALDRLFQAAAKVGPDAANPPALALTPELLWGLVIFWGGISLMSIPMWHAPALVHWGGQRVAQALFSSALALWRTRAAFAVYTLAWAGTMAGVAVFAGLLAALGLRNLAVLMVMPVGLSLSTVFYVSLYFCFTDTFEITPPP